MSRPTKSCSCLCQILHIEPPNVRSVHFALTILSGPANLSLSLQSLSNTHTHTHTHTHTWTCEYAGISGRRNVCLTMYGCAGCTTRDCGYTQNPVNVRCMAESGTHIQYTYHSCMYITYSAVCVCECVCCSRAFVSKHFVYLDAGAILLLSLCVDL